MQIAAVTVLHSQEDHIVDVNAQVAHRNLAVTAGHQDSFSFMRFLSVEIMADARE